MTETRHECPECELILWHAEGSEFFVCLECGAEWTDEASLVARVPGVHPIKRYPGARVATPNGLQRLYSWHPAPECPYVYTTDDDGRMHMWTKSQLEEATRAFHTT